MNWLAGTGFIGLAAGLLYIFVDQKPADVYDMPVQNAYALLVNPDFGDLSDGAKALNTQRSAVGNGRDKVTWRTSGSHSRRECALQLAPFEGDASRTHITVTCQGGGAGEGAAAGMAHNMHRNRVIERVDATLTGRPFDPQRVGSTASRWPGDGVDGSYAGAVNSAMQMDMEMKKMEAEASQRAVDYENAVANGYGSDDWGN